MVNSRDVHDIAYWMLDDDYDGSNFVAKQVFFCGGDKDEFDDWKKKLGNLSLLATKKRAEQLLKIEIDDEAFARIYGHISHPFKTTKDQKSRRPRNLPIWRGSHEGPGIMSTRNCLVLSQYRDGSDYKD